MRGRTLLRLCSACLLQVGLPLLCWRLLPAEEPKPPILPHVLEILPVGCNHGCSYGTRSQGNQDVEGEFLDLAPIIAFCCGKACDHLCAVEPDTFCRCVQAEVGSQVECKLSLCGSSGASEQFVNYNGEPAKEKRALSNPLGETACPKVLDVDRGVQDGKFNCRGRPPAGLPRCASARPVHARPSPRQSPLPRARSRWGYASSNIASPVSIAFPLSGRSPAAARPCPCTFPPNRNRATVGGCGSVSRQLFL